MFAIYNINGRYFRNSLEALHEVRDVSNSSKSLMSLKNGSLTSEHPTNKSSYIAPNVIDRYREVLHLQQRDPIYHAYQLMSTQITTVWTRMDILSARRFMKKHRFHQMPVLNASNSIVGMLTIEDLLRSINIENNHHIKLSGNYVADIMSDEVITADPVTDIRRIAQVMQEYRLSGIPIVNEADTLIGMVSRSDILRAVTHDPPLNMWS